jgi:hypothetical protein
LAVPVIDNMAVNPRAIIKDAPEEKVEKSFMEE